MKILAREVPTWARRAEPELLAPAGGAFLRCDVAFVGAYIYIYIYIYVFREREIERERDRERERLYIYIYIYIYICICPAGFL